MSGQIVTQSVATVTVAISTRDRAEALGRCLAALQADEVVPKEIVVVDQSRDDRTRQVVERARSTIVNMIYVKHHGAGLGRSQNCAFAHASCDIVAVTDDDCVPAPGWIATIAAALTPPGGVDVLTGPVLPLGSPQPGMYSVSSRSSTTRTDFGPDSMPWDIGSGNNLAARRVWLEKIGGNDERLGPGSPGRGAVDMDLFYRLLRAGARIRYEPDARVYHERTTLSGRLGRRIPYGYGIGAMCGMQFRQGDRDALRLLRGYLRARLSRLWNALRGGHPMVVYEEILVLSGICRGLAHGVQIKAPR